VPLSPTELTLRELRKTWPLVAVVERWNAHTRIRQDLFGILDVIAVGPGGTVGVQSTSRGNLSARRNKIMAHPDTPTLLVAGWAVVLHGWDKPAHRWRLKEERITLEGIEQWKLKHPVAS
jgi:hypothetical protein